MAIESIERLTVQLGRLPGIGRKTAARLAYHILGVPEEQAQELAQAITDARSKVHNCPICGTYTDGELCEICSDPRRRTDVLCVVSDPRDVIAMEKTREFNGRYHVLFGALSPMEGIGPKRRTDLMKAFKSVRAIREADVGQLRLVVPKNTAEKVYAYFHPTDKEE